MWLKDRSSWSTLEKSVIFVLASVCCGTAVYGEYSGFQNPMCNPDLHQDHCGSGWTNAQKIIYGATHRSVWAIGLALICLLCFKDQFPFVNWFLSHKFLKPLARVSFMMYLAQEDILTVYNSDTMERTRYSWRWFVVNFFGSVVVVFLIALAFHAVFEAPFAKLTKMLLKKIGDTMKQCGSTGTLQRV